jgi:hypothetical protein
VTEGCYDRHVASLALVTFAERCGVMCHGRASFAADPRGWITVAVAAPRSLALAGGWIAADSDNILAAGRRRLGYRGTTSSYLQAPACFEWNRGGSHA